MSDSEDDDESTTFDADNSDSESDISPGNTNASGFGTSAGGLDFISDSGYPKIEFGSDDEYANDGDGAVVFESDSGKYSAKSRNHPSDKSQKTTLALQIPIHPLQRNEPCPILWLPAPHERYCTFRWSCAKSERYEI